MFLALGAAFAGLVVMSSVGASPADTPSAQLASRQECQGDTPYITLVASDWTAASALDKAGTPAYWSLFGGSPDSSQTNLAFGGDHVTERFTLRTYKSNDPAFPTWESAWASGAIDLGPKYTVGSMATSSGLACRTSFVLMSVHHRGSHRDAGRRDVLGHHPYAAGSERCGDFRAPFWGHGQLRSRHYPAPNELGFPLIIRSIGRYQYACSARANP